MMRVVLRDGTIHTFPSAYFCDMSTSTWTLYTQKEGTWLASFPRDFVALVDAGNERRATTPIDPDAALRVVADNVYDYTDDKHYADLRFLKSALKHFSARSGWKLQSGSGAG